MILKNICAIDPGKNGGICFLGNEVVAHSFKTNRMIDILGIMRKYNPDHVYIEDVRLISPGKKATSSLSEQIGIFIGFCLIYGTPYTFVRPQTWQKHYGIVKCTNNRNKKGECDDIDSDRTWKERLRVLAEELSDGEINSLDTCDAYLIARYASVQTV